MTGCNNLLSMNIHRTFRLKHGDPEKTGWSPRRRYQLNYFTPDDYYEALLDHLVQEGVRWLDVGGGRSLLPENPILARSLADRCDVLVGVDPSETIEENPYLHRRAQCFIEDYRSAQEFDLATLRMVAEHIADPESAIAALARLVRPGGQVVIYTVNVWSPLAVLARAVPFCLHHPVKQCFWGTEEKDTFPVHYRMNARHRLRHLFDEGGFSEQSFYYLDDCRTFHRYRSLHLAELRLWQLLRALRVRYPENCLLGIYRKR